MGADALSDVFRAVRLTGAVFFNLDVRDPWVAEAPRRQGLHPATSCPAAQHLIEYHIVSKGSCWGGLLDAEQVLLEAATSSSSPKAMRMCSRARPACGIAPDFSVAVEGGRDAAPVWGARSAATGRRPRRSSAASSAAKRGRSTRCSPTLPRMLHLRAASMPENGWLGSFIRAAVDEADNKRPGGEGVLARLSELMFIEVVRRYVESLPAEQTGWLAGLRDRHVGRALNLLHGNPSRAWTLDQLVKEVGLSRSSLVERFSHFVGTAADAISRGMAHADRSRASRARFGQCRARGSGGRL